MREHIAHGYSASAACTRCRENLPGLLDLQGLVDRGLGDKPLKQTGTACPKCKAPVHFTVHPAKGYGK